MSLISPNFAVKSIIFPNFGQGSFPKIAGKSPGPGQFGQVEVIQNPYIVTLLPHLADIVLEFLETLAPIRESPPQFEN